MSPPLALPRVADQALGAHGHLPMLQYEQLQAVVVPAAGPALHHPLESDPQSGHPGRCPRRRSARRGSHEGRGRRTRLRERRWLYHRPTLISSLPLTAQRSSVATCRQPLATPPQAKHARRSVRAELDSHPLLDRGSWRSAVHPVFGLLGHHTAARRLRRPTIARAQHSAPCPHGKGIIIASCAPCSPATFASLSESKLTPRELWKLTYNSQICIDRLSLNTAGDSTLRIVPSLQYSTYTSNTWHSLTRSCCTHH